MPTFRELLVAFCVVFSLVFLPTGVEAKKKKRIAKKSLVVKKHARPLGSVLPRVAPNYRPRINASVRMQRTIAAYKFCMYSETEDRIAFALALNLDDKDDPDLRGTPEKLGYEVCLADALGLPRYETQDDIDAKKGIDLVEIDSPLVDIPDQLPDERRYARPWVREYVNTLALDMRNHFEEKARASGTFANFTPLRISSLVRSFADQRRQRNSPASCRNEICSTHTTGAAVDISNSARHLNPEERSWIKDRLLEDRASGKIIMIQEYSAPHFHMLVLPPEYVSTK